MTKALEGNYSYYQLTAKGAKSRGHAPNKALPKGESALAQNLAALWSSCMGPLWRKRLTDGELGTLFGAPTGQNVIYIAQNATDDQTSVFRLFIPSENTGVKRGYVQALRKSACQDIEQKRLLPWIERGTYSFAVLVHNSSKKRKTELPSAIQRGVSRNQIHLDIAPTPSSLRQFFSPVREDENDYLTPVCPARKQTQYCLVEEWVDFVRDNPGIGDTVQDETHVLGRASFHRMGDYNRLFQATPRSRRDGAGIYSDVI